MIHFADFAFWNFIRINELATECNKVLKYDKNCHNFILEIRGNTFHVSHVYELVTSVSQKLDELELLINRLKKSFDHYILIHNTKSRELLITKIDRKKTIDE